LDFGYFKKDNFFTNEYYEEKVNQEKDLLQYYPDDIPICDLPRDFIIKVIHYERIDLYNQIKKEYNELKKIQNGKDLEKNGIERDPELKKEIMDFPDAEVYY